ncbi:ABC transporter substrate-binding protein [Paenibacillus thiaminolyticus]|uniref:ABC transporter substrate-binding protein n=1 Tax=Paenibacillus thiaminolyticus TaxID=49283 RepID=A0A3A3GI18_PANTH|nr:ABC transporter substrate-binding protein [Paenibacillus thiaminolyticus]RJG22981.1 ABC transporter substrate-binding protein [Paenibacillus thiaminolyticus]
MKKSWVIFLCLLMSLTLVLSACTGGGDAAEPTKESAQEQQGNKPEKKGGEEASDSGDSGFVNEGIVKASDPSKSPATATSRTDTLIIGMSAPAGIFHPLYAETVYDQYVMKTLFKGMLEVQKDGTYAPVLAEKYEVSPDNLTHTYKLKEGLKFSDGSALTAEDVAFTITVLHDSSYDGPMDILRDAKIKGGREYFDGKATSIEGIKVIDPLTIEFTTIEPSALAQSSIGATEIISKAYYGKDYKQGNLSYMNDLFTTPLGNGPYKLEKFQAGQDVSFVANENYFKGAPKISKLIYKFTTDETNAQLLQTGETDMDFISANLDNFELLQSMGFLDISLFPTNGYGYIAFNHNRVKFQDVKVRQALAIGLDREQIVEAVYQGYADVINVPQSKLSWAYTDEVNKYEFDLEKAKLMLDEAGWKVGADGLREKDGEKFKINFAATSPNVVNEAIIPVAQANYKALGIEFVAEQMDFNAVIEKRKKGDFDMLFMAWGLTPDPQSAQNVFITGGSQNEIGYSNKKVDELFEKGGKTLDVEERKAIYKELYQEINEDMPYIFMYQRRDMWGNNARFTGLDMTPYRDFSYGVDSLMIN